MHSALVQLCIYSHIRSTMESLTLNIWTPGPGGGGSNFFRRFFTDQGHHQLSPEKSNLNQGQMTDAP